MSLDTAPEPTFPAPTKSGTAGNRSDKAAQLRLVRRTAAAAVELAQAATGRREMLATLLGLRRGATDTVALVVGLYEADASAAQPVTALLAIAENPEPIDAVVAAVELAEDRDRAKAVWMLLTTLKEVTGPLPTVAAKAGGAIAKAAQSLDQASLVELRALRDLLR